MRRLSWFQYISVWYIIAASLLSRLSRVFDYIWIQILARFWNTFITSRVLGVMLPCTLYRTGGKVQVYSYTHTIWWGPLLSVYLFYREHLLRKHLPCNPFSETQSLQLMISNLWAPYIPLSINVQNVHVYEPQDAFNILDTCIPLSLFLISSLDPL